MNFGLPPKSHNLIIQSLKNNKEIEKAAIFGSRALGNFKNGSDVDLVIFGSEITPQLMLRLAVQLNEELPLPYHFDLVHYESINDQALKNHIDTWGSPFYQKEPKKGG